MESAFKGPADISVPVAIIPPRCFYAYFCPYSPLCLAVFSQPIYLTRPGGVAGRLLPLDASQPPPCSPGAGRAAWLPSQLGGGHGQMPKFTSIPPPPQLGEQTCASFSSAAQGCRFDKLMGHSSSRKPTDAALGVNPRCPSARWGSPLAAVPTDNSTQAVPRDVCRGYQAVCCPYSAPPELRQADCFLTHSCTR